MGRRVAYRRPSSFFHKAGDELSVQKLESYGFKKVGQFRIADQRFIVEITDEETSKLEKCVYILVIGDEVARVGSSKAPLKNRLRSYERDISAAIKGQKSSTPGWEAKKWVERLAAAGHGEIFARQGTTVTTPIGTFPVYLDEESRLISEFWHDDILNRNKHR